VSESEGHPDRVFISGMGVMTSLADSVSELADVLAELSAVRRTEQARRPGPPRLALLPAFDLADFLETQRPYLDTQSRCALAAAAMALDNAAVEPDEVDPLLCGLYYANALGNLDTLATFGQVVEQKGMRLASPVLFSHAYANSTASLLSIEFALAGANHNFCGSRLCGAEALQGALMALDAGQADLILTGGADAVAPELLDRIWRRSPDELTPGQGAALLVLETQDSVERREGYAFCELGSVVCMGTRGDKSAGGIAAALEATVEAAIAEAGLWDGDIALVFRCGAPASNSAAAEAERRVMERFSQVPTSGAGPFVGDTFAASFPLECALAAEALSASRVPGDVTLWGETRGVEVWVEGRPEAMLGTAALVVGCTPEMAAAAVLVAM
jgi:3-oxoacyl-[acyl-carrier-protein] synthase II